MDSGYKWQLSIEAHENICQWRSDSKRDFAFQTMFLLKQGLWKVMKDFRPSSYLCHRARHVFTGSSFHESLGRHQTAELTQVCHHVHVFTGLKEYARGPFHYNADRNAGTTTCLKLDLVRKVHQEDQWDSKHRGHWCISGNR